MTNRLHFRQQAIKTEASFLPVRPPVFLFPFRQTVFPFGFGVHKTTQFFDENENFCHIRISRVDTVRFEEQNGRIVPIAYTAAGEAVYAPMDTNEKAELLNDDATQSVLHILHGVYRICLNSYPTLALKTYGNNDGSNNMTAPWDNGNIFVETFAANDDYQLWELIPAFTVTS